MCVLANCMQWHQPIARVMSQILLGKVLNPAFIAQALERHHAQQRLWANSVGSNADLSPGASPRDADTALLQQQLAMAAASSRPLGGGGSFSLVRLPLCCGSLGRKHAPS